MDVLVAIVALAMLLGFLASGVENTANK